MKVRVRAVIRKEGKLLLVQHQGHNTWCLPGGGIEDGENIIDALKREVREELGRETIVGELLTVHQFKEHGHWQGPEFFFEVLNAEDFEAIDTASTSHGPAEIARVEFRDPLATEDLRPAFIPELLTAKTMLVKISDS